MRNEKVTYYWSYLAMPKDFGLCYMNNFDITRKLIGAGMLFQSKQLRIELWRLPCISDVINKNMS